jgi:hypothetical protein
MRFAFAFGSVVLALVVGTAAPALAAPPIAQAQVSNSAPMPCVGAAQADAGTFTLSAVQRSATVVQNADGTQQAQFQFDLRLSYSPADPAAATWTGTQTVSASVPLTPGWYSASTVPVSIPVTSSTQATTTLSGSLSLSVSETGDLTSFGSSDWSCPVLSTASVPTAPAPTIATLVMQVWAMHIDWNWAADLFKEFFKPKKKTDWINLLDSFIARASREAAKPNGKITQAQAAVLIQLALAVENALKSSS